MVWGAFFAAVIASVRVSAWLVVGSAPVTAAADPGEHSHEADQSSRKPSRNSDDGYSYGPASAAPTARIGLIFGAVRAVAGAMVPQRSG
ncbi:Uncharacterised protein [Mycobacteroides abscessus subsp. massiliense]|nr:Uncharacterised protein [Mycobacteroides abscessus subsp. massiliense]